MNKWDLLGMMGDAEAAAELAIHWLLPNGDAPFLRFGGTWAEFFKNKNEVRLEASKFMADEATKAWASSNDNGSYYNKKGMYIDGSFFTRLSMNSMSYVGRGRFRVDRDSCTVELYDNLHGMFDRFDSLPRSSEAWNVTDGIGSIARVIGILDNPFSKDRRTLQFFDIEVVWTSSDVVMAIDMLNGCRAVARGVNAWPFGN